MATQSRRMVFCVHCDSDVPKSTYYRHREEFFDPVTNVWRLPGSTNFSSNDDHLSGVTDTEEEEMQTASETVHSVFEIEDNSLNIINDQPSPLAPLGPSSESGDQDDPSDFQETLPQGS